MEAKTNIVSSEDQTEDPGNFAMLANVSTDSTTSPTCAASHSSGRARRFSGGARHSTGASPFSGRASHSTGGASHSSGVSSPVGGIATDMGIKKFLVNHIQLQKK